ncbi:hypothetical protein BGW36DRAFT_371845 [Talaromyces proteolyticus]|uniref:Uncharacterized protein n=1 Tax=Talaromyces proteolyticus TaxID=1131652 RepID=A0AAD4L0K7_9EURO|nr:uncharacterized protein BGW36DRAFT_371845 [Talaromyces proteolyticus]KAH8701921.1 hypothetical protein BGW36DRAFT_371845 [Talaromyces proteolyticus]
MSDIRPQFFIVREEGTITPLVALDELPSDLTVRGVPRNMNPAETRGMTSLGTMPSRGAFYIVESLNDRVGITEVTDDSFAITPFTGGDAGKGKNRVSEKKVSPPTSSVS